ncbi:MAG TPA: hypothetical protein VK325_04580 [Pseudoxanthomonas sp.]|nr:hypothetical protein [Pseudoxanthomonas sp.]
MTDVRKLPLDRGLAWFLRGVNTGRRNPKAVFGASVLLIFTLYVVSFLLLLPIAWSDSDSSGAVPKLDIRLVMPFFLVLIGVFPVLMGGLMHVIREVEASRPVRARDLFTPARSGGLKNLLLLGLVQLAFNLAAAALVLALAGSGYWSEYLAAIHGAMSGSIPVMPEPAHPFLMFVVNVLFNYVSGVILLMAIPLILFSGANLGESLKLSLRTARMNLAPNLTAAALYMLAVLASALVVSVVGAVLGSVLALIHPLLGMLTLLVLYLAFGTAVLAVMAACAHAAWSDVFESIDKEKERTVASARFEA